MGFGDDNVLQCGQIDASNGAHTGGGKNLKYMKRNTLSEKGIFMINLWGSDSKTPLYIDRINLVFDQQVLYTESSKPGNVIVFAFNEKNVEYPINILRQKIKSLEMNYGLDLMVYFSRLIKNNKRGNSKKIRFH